MSYSLLHLRLVGLKFLGSTIQDPFIQAPEGGLISYGTALLPAPARGLIWRVGAVGGDVAFCDFCSLILFLSRAPSSFQVLFCRLKGNRAHRSERNVQVDWLLRVCLH